MSNAKTRKQDGVWLFADGTKIPDQDRAESDVHYRESTNKLVMLMRRFGSGDAPLSIEEIEAARIKFGW